jgi:adenosylhomocysteine nucleosidase
MGTIGILAAVHDEIAGLLADMAPGSVTHRIGMRDYHCGRIAGRDCVVVLARIGKVAAAVTTTTLIRQFGAEFVLCTGLAGGIGPGVRVGDVVVADTLLQHDMDARPLFKRYEVPLLDRARFDTDPAYTALLAREALAYVNESLAADIDAPTLAHFGIRAPAVHRGLIASGIPYAVLRTISDRADAHATTDFKAFLAAVASVYSHGVVHRMLAATASNRLHSPATAR